jgi:hypothetical protein
MVKTHGPSVQSYYMYSTIPRQPSNLQAIVLLSLLSQKNNSLDNSRDKCLGSSLNFAISFPSQRLG